MAERGNDIEGQFGAGRVIIPANVNVWPHELKTAEALARAGYTVEFIQRSDIEHERAPDALIDGMAWEMKAPKSCNIGMISKNIRRALHQSDCVVFDSRRMKSLPDKAIEREVRLRARQTRALKHLLYINRCGEVVHVK